MGVSVAQPEPGVLVMDERRRPHAGRAVRARRADPGLDQRARSAAHPLRRGPAVDARRRRLRCPPDRHARRRPGGDGRHVQVRPRRAPRDGDRLHGADIAFSFPSVGATENIVTAAVFAEGTTTIDNAAREPEVVDLCDLLVKMGADIDGIGTSRIVDQRRRAGTLAGGRPRHRPRPHPGGDLPRRRRRRRRRARRRSRRAAEHMENLLARFTDMGLEFDDRRRLAAGRRRGRLRSIDVPTLPYPGIATDYKPLIITMLSVADGAGIVTENLYPGSLPLRRGADPPRAPTSAPTGHHAVVRGVPRLSGAPVRAHDIRAGRGDGRRRPRRRGRDHDQRGRTTSTAATTTSSAGWRRSAPASSASEPGRSRRGAFGAVDARFGDPQQPRRRPRSGSRRAAPRPTRPDARTRRQGTERCAFWACWVSMTGAVRVGDVAVERIALDERSWVDVGRGWLAGADELFEHLREHVPWSTSRLYRYDHFVEERRLGASWRRGSPLPHPVLADATVAAVSVRRVLRGLQPDPARDGHDGQRFHRDTDMRYLDDTVIAVLSLGAQRPWLLRPHASKLSHAPCCRARRTTSPRHPETSS